MVITPLCVYHIAVFFSVCCPPPLNIFATDCLTDFQWNENIVAFFVFLGAYDICVCDVFTHLTTTVYFDLNLVGPLFYILYSLFVG